MLSSIATVAWFSLAVGAGVWDWSFWWVAIASFVAGSLHLSSGPGFDIVMSANRDGRLGVLPRMLFFHVFPYLLIGAVIFWLSRWLAN